MVLFIMDCTGSMGGWIDKSRQAIKKIMAETQQQYANLGFSVAFVGYRDFGDEEHF